MSRLIQQILRFIIVGGLATLIDFLVLTVLYYYYHVHYLLATPVAFIISTLFNYWASMTYIFKSRYQPEEKTKEIFIFVGLSIFGLFLTEVLMAITVEYLTLPVILAKLCVTAIVMIFNFVSRKVCLEDTSYKRTKFRKEDACD